MHSSPISGAIQSRLSTHKPTEPNKSGLSRARLFWAPFELTFIRPHHHEWQVQVQVQVRVRVRVQSPYLVVMSIFFKVPGSTKKSKSLANREAKFKSTGQEREMGAGICEVVSDAVMCVCGGSL
jgi:hypothetical protein